MDLVDLPHSDAGPRSALPIILLHGFPLDHRMWRAQKDALVSAGARVIVPDLRGFGKAPPGHGVPSMREYAADVLRLADRAGISRFGLAGFSMGGYVAFEILRQAPERIAGLALVDTRAEADTEGSRAGRKQSAENVRNNGGLAGLADAMLPKHLTPDAPPELREEVRAMMLSQPPDGIANALLAMGARPDSRPILPSVHVPTLIVVGTLDTLTPPEDARTMAEAIPGAFGEVVEGAAHLAPMERPVETSAMLVAWKNLLR